MVSPVAASVNQEPVTLPYFSRLVIRLIWFSFLVSR